MKLLFMKVVLISQLKVYKFDNSKDSKEAILDSLSSLKGSTIGGKSTSLVEGSKEVVI